ncbi:ATP-binding protein [Flavobacteriaceae bacterium]|nr:ATP-binding protein [Flavobacteriaceae bacterium]
MLGEHAGHKINALRERLVDSNARSVFVNAHPKKSRVKLDLHSLSKLCLNLQDQYLLNQFLFNPSFQISPSPQLKINERDHKKTPYLFRKNEAFKNEFNLDPMGLGYPLLLSKSKNKKQYQLTPLFIWDVSLTQSSIDPSIYSYKIKQSESVSLNPSLIRYLRRSANMDHILGFEEIENEPNQLIEGINAILKLAGEKPISSSFLEQPLNPLPQDLDETFVLQNSKLINNGVFGLFANSKEPIITDYLTLEEEAITCHFRSNKDTNKTHFSGLDLDHSQQGVIRSLRHRKNTIIHGPPGTGKSNTITAVINYALSKGQKCLLVCEKKTAMEVIYQNLIKLGVSDYVVKITDIKKDRRAVINKARDIIEFEKKGGQNLFKTLDKDVEGIIGNKEQSERRVKTVNATIGLISKIKRKLNLNIINGGDSYSDLVLKTQTNDLIKLSEILNLKAKLYAFSSSEWELISADLTFLKQYLHQNPNPSKSFYPYLQKTFFDGGKEPLFRSTLRALDENYFEDLEQLINDWKEAGAKLNAYQIKYFNYIKSDNIQLQRLYDRYVFLKKSILNSPLFDKQFRLKIERLEPLLQLEKIHEVMRLMKSNIEDFNALIPYHDYFSKCNAPRKACLIRACKIVDFENLFHRWYTGNILDKNHITYLDFNGFEKGYFDLVEDLNKINSFYSAIAKRNAKTTQSQGISSFEKNSSLTIEQFFSKRSSAKRVKLPLHKITRDSSEIFGQLFPIVITNPSSCSHLFPMEKGYFDFVVFDESSQLRIEDTLPALLRGKVSVVSGDTQQLPPSNYFREIDDSDDLTGNEENMTSLLEFCKTSSFQDHYLDIHYRSNHPDLIQFSNHAFYQKRLIPLPPLKKYKSIQFETVNGLFVNRTNIKEAQAIINYLTHTADSNESLGVATFSQFQQNLILDMILKKSINQPKFKIKMEELWEQGFFVKNIENIQGEERDIMLISTTYGPNKTGRFNQLFGPLNTKNKGHKLLNVVITRAIKKMVVFSSVPPQYYENYHVHLEQKGIIGKGVFYAFISYAKAVSENNIQQQQKILNTLYRSSNSIPDQTNFRKDDLKLFSNHLTKVLIEKSGHKIDCVNEFALGGITYEMLLIFEDGNKLLIDLNGKEVNREYEDYLYDIYRCKIAQKSGYRYYRLWLSNYYNQPLKEINNILATGAKGNNS